MGIQDGGAAATFPGVSVIESAYFGRYNPTDPRYGAKAGGAVDARAAFLATQAACGANGVMEVPPGVYRFAADTAITSAIALMPGAVIKPDNGVTVTLSKLDGAPRSKWIDTSAGGVVAFDHGAVDRAFPEWWGATPNTGVDCYAAFYAMQQACLGTLEVSEVEGVIPTFTDAGAWTLSHPIPLYSGNKFLTAGVSTIFLAAAGFVGDRLFDLVEKRNILFCSYVEVGDFTADQGPVTGLAAVKATAGDVLNCEFGNIHLNTSFGLILGTYAQFNVVKRLYSFGPIDQLLYLKGNMNHVYDLDKESGTGTTVDPYVLLVGDGNTIDHLLLEGTGSVNKHPIEINNGDFNTIRQYWQELSATDGYLGVFTDCKSTTMESVPAGLFTTSKLKLRNCPIFVLRAVSTQNSNTLSIDAMLDIDSYSTVIVDGLESKNGSNGLPLDQPNIRVGATGIENVKFFGYTDVSTAVAPANRFGGNLLTNPSFDAGRYGWVFDNVPDLMEEYIASEVGFGLMAHFRWSVGIASTNVYTSITVPAGWVGRPITMSMLVKVTDSAGSPIAVAYPYIRGTGWGAHKVLSVSANSGWRIMQFTVYALAAGAMRVGVTCDHSSATADFYVDEFSCVLGAEAQVNPARFGSVDIGNHTVLYAAAAPTTGTWRVGDWVRNSAPAVGSPKGWICTVAGTPGTWVSEGNL